MTRPTKKEDEVEVETEKDGKGGNGLLKQEEEEEEEDDEEEEYACRLTVGPGTVYPAVTEQFLPDAFCGEPEE